MYSSISYEPNTRGGPLLYTLLAANLGLTLVITPFSGVFLRYRANYSPKAVSLVEDAEVEGDASAANGDARTGPVVDGYFAMFCRVYRMEGLAGLYKGFMPVFLLALFVSTMGLVVYGSEGLPERDPKTEPSVSILVLFAASLVPALVTLPITVITYRAIATPYKLPYFTPKTAFLTLLTPTERPRPWELYLTPGLVLASVIQLVVVLLVLVPLQRLVLPSIPRSKEEWDLVRVEMVLRLTTYVMLVVLVSIVVVPFEVMRARLALQRNHKAGPESEGAREARLEGLDVYSSEEDVIGVRDEADPYTSLMDCAKRMVREEGWKVMFRAWWITFLPLVISGVFEAWQRSQFRGT